VFVVGAATMGLEMSASRLLAPYFGNSLPVWGILIGMMLAFLSGGYLLGGRLASRSPAAFLLEKLVAWAGLALGLLPHLSRPILQKAAAALAGYQAGAVLGSLIGVMCLFAVPVILLAMALPIVVDLQSSTPESSGRSAGRVYALSTAGSLLGTFATVFVLIPNVGTRSTLLAISLSLLGSVTICLLRRHPGRAAVVLLVALVLAALHYCQRGPVKPTVGLLFETDSAYNYIQVVQRGEEVQLKLNEGEGIQSTFHPTRILTGLFYDYLLLAPLFRSEPSTEGPASVCLIGLAAGTCARQYSAAYGPVPITGVEIDPAIVEAGRRFFALDRSNLQIIVDDGRHYLANSTATFDVILLDAYRPPYIPFHLATVEFFDEALAHLSTDGVLAVNVARTEEGAQLVEAIGCTLGTVFPSVYVIDVTGNLNSILIASRQGTQLPLIEQKLLAVSQPLLQNVVQRAWGRIREFASPKCTVLTDDHAPVEQIVHTIMAQYLIGRPTQEGTQ